MILKDWLFLAFMLTTFFLIVYAAMNRNDSRTLRKLRPPFRWPQAWSLSVLGRVSRHRRIVQLSRLRRQ